MEGIEWESHPLLDAGRKGDIEFVMRLYNGNREDPSLSFLSTNAISGRNFVHYAVESERYTFLFEALNTLSTHPRLVIQLMGHKGKIGNPIHRAAKQGNIFVLQLLVNAYITALSSIAHNTQETPPWLATASSEFTPLRFSFQNSMPTQENIAMYLVSVDEHFSRSLSEARRSPMDLCSTLVVDHHGVSIVFIAMQRGYSQLAKQILTSRLLYSLSGGQSGETPLHYASRCTEEVSRLLLDKHPELIKKVSSSGKTMLDHAVEEGTTWLVKLMLIQEEETNQPKVPWTKACRRLIWHVNENGDTPLHIAARRGDIKISKLLTQGYKSALLEETKYHEGADTLPEPGNDLMGVNPFCIKNSEDDIPLDVALRKKYDRCGLVLSDETFPSRSVSSSTPPYKKSLPIAIENGCLLSAKKILESVILSSRVCDLGYRLKDLGIQSHLLLKIGKHITREYPEEHEMVKTEELEKFLEVLPRFLREYQPDTETILEEAAERGEDWLVILALDSDDDIFEETVPAWQVACKKGYTSILLIFIEFYNPLKFIELCRKVKQTPLHHINLEQFEQYVELLKNPVLANLKNERDTDGATPLHRAIQRCDLKLTKALLETDGIGVCIEDNDGTTALDLLEKKCKLSNHWFEQYMALLKMPGCEKLLNQVANDGTTPLQRAIQRDHLELTKALLETEGIEVDIKDKIGKTSLDLLQKSCGFSPSWGKMCREIKQDSTVKKLKYLFRKISFEGMQQTLSLVAALVATITFAAGFAVPGGPDSSNGTPVLATKAAFLAFSISNTLAMCCSIMVLFLLLGPMMWDPHPSLFYVNLSLTLLLMSLGGTMVAFMTGVYATMASKVKWEAILVTVLCSLALLMACILLLVTYSSRCRNLFSNPFNCLNKSSAEATIVVNENTTSQQPARSSNMSVIQAYPSPLTELETPKLYGEQVGQATITLHPTSDNDVKIEIKHQEYS